LPAGFHCACSAVRPSTAVATGTNQSSALLVVRSCSSRTPRKSLGGLGFWAAAAIGSSAASSRRAFFITGLTGTQGWRKYSAMAANAEPGTCHRQTGWELKGSRIRGGQSPTRDGGDRPIRLAVVVLGVDLERQA